MSLASATAENQALDGMFSGTVAIGGFVSLHSASPGTTGANENAATGGYTRQAATWNAASGGSKTNSGALTFATSGTVAVTHAGTNSASGTSGGTYGIGAALASSITAASITFASGSISFTAS